MLPLTNNLDMAALPAIARWRDALGPLGFGGAALGNLFAQVPERHAEVAVSSALANGISYFDTAPFYGYGLSETRLGRLVPPDARISTKVGRLVSDDGPVGADGFAVAGRAWFDYSRDGVRRSVEASLKRLGRDRVDILLLHDVGALTHGERHTEMLAQALDEALPTLIDLREAGVCDAIGIGVNETAVCRTILAEMPLDLILLAGRYTLIEQGDALPLLEDAAQRGTGIIAGGPYNSGLLAPADRPGAHYDYAAPPQSIEARAAALYALAARHGVDVGAAALAFPAAHPAVVTTLAGMRDAGEVIIAARRIAADIPGAFWADLIEHALLGARTPTP